MIVEVVQMDCGHSAYSKLVVSHNWNPPPLNVCQCGKPITRWTVVLGHVCDCGRSCNRQCVKVAA